MNTRTAQTLATAQTIVGALIANIQSDLDGAAGADAKLAMAQALQDECGKAVAAITDKFVVARLGLLDTAAALELQLRDAALARVVTMLNNGSLKLSDLTDRVTVAVVPASIPVAQVAQVAPVAPIAPVESVVAAVNAAPTPAAAAGEQAAPVTAAPETAAANVQAETVAGPEAKRKLTRTPIPAHVNEAAIALCSPKIRQSLRDSLRSELRPGSKPIAYRDPSTGIGWTGVGKPPAWLTELLVDGKALEDFRVKGSVTAPVADAAAAVETQTDAAAATEQDVAGDIGPEKTMEFDASGFDGGEPSGADDDIGDFLTGLQSVGSDRSPGNVSSFMAAA